MELIGIITLLLIYCLWRAFESIVTELVNSYTRKLKKEVLDLVEKTIEEHFLSYFLFGFKLQDLKKSIDDLQDKRVTLQNEVDDENCNGKDATAEVSKWLKKANDIIIKTNKFQEYEHLPYTECYLPKPWIRYRLAKKAYRLASEVNKLCQSSPADAVIFSRRPMSIDFILHVPYFESFNSRKQVRDDISKVLKDTSIKMVGVYGAGGVGKTTFVKEVASRAQKDKFDVVIFVTVTRNPNIKQLQGQLADQLGAKLNEETEIGRASRLRDIFKKEKKDTLVVLDDVWAKLDFNKLGIPIDDVNPTPNFAKDTTKNHMFKEEGTSGDVGGKKEATSLDGQEKKEAIADSKTLKILLTSRSKEALFDNMDVKENSCFHIEGLEKQEAEHLFKKMVGMVDKPYEFEPLAVKISHKCAGLPIAIITIGKALRTKSYSQWEHTLGQLEQQEFAELAKPVDFSTRLSFNYLENEELKSTFLLCAQLGYHPLIKDLVKYCIGVGIFEGFLTIKETHEKVLIFIEKLKDSSLLLGSYSDDCFNMHDMIREIALSIASKERHVFIMRNGKLKDWPHKNEFKKYNGISIGNCDINDKLPDFVSCPRLKIFHVDCRNPSFSIPARFFKGATQLRLLILAGIDVSNFSTSIGCLTCLRMLCLEKCKLGDISFIGKLEKLRILSLSGSIIENLPTELGNLHKLQLLDISNCSELKEIPPNVLANLHSLEELYMRNSVKWGSEGNQSKNKILDELRYLHQLKNLDVCFSSVAVLPRNLFLNKLDVYKIVIGDFKPLDGEYFKMPAKDEGSRVLALQIKNPNVIHYQQGVKILFRGVEKMLLGEMNGVKNVFCGLNLEGFPCLKELSIVENSGIECIIDSREMLNLNNVFPILESLCLHKLGNMRKISQSRNLSGTSFSILKVVRIHVCDQLENVFSFSMLLLLKNLETIDIRRCKFMKTIVLKEEHDGEINFPKLCSLELAGLHNFTGVYSNYQDQNDDFILLNEQVEIPNLESLEVSSMHMKEISSQLKHFEKLTKLNVQNCDRLQYLFSFSMAESMKKLKFLSVRNCDKMVEIFNYEIQDNEAREVCVFPKLEEIHIAGMSSLTTIWPRECSPDSFTSLNSMYVGDCRQLVTAVPSHMVGRFGRLESLRIGFCDSMEQIFDLNGAKKPSVAYETPLQVLQIYYGTNLKCIWNGDPEGILNFKRLHSIDVFNNLELRYLFPVSVAKNLQELDSLFVSDCPQMEEIARGDEGLNENFEFPQVSVLEMQRLPKLKCFFKGRRKIRWPKLKQLSVLGCDQLEAFKTETQNSNRGPSFLPEEVIPKLETMEIGLMEVEKLKLCIKNYWMNDMNNFLVASCPSIEILYQFLYRMPYLERLTLSECKLTELIPRQESFGIGNPEIQENIGAFLQLKYLELQDLNALENIGFERAPVLQHCLEHLHIEGCKKLINLAPSSVTLTHLTTLEVHDCWRMKNLMGFSTAKSLVQLVSLTVFNCTALEEIVAGQNDEIEITYQHHENVFSKLMTLELVDLPSLSCFCSFEICDPFKFPSLEKLIVDRCPRMTKFCNRLYTPPNLQVIEINREEENWSWKGDLNDRMLKMFTRSCHSHLSLFDYPELEYIWHGQIPLSDNSFQHLEILVVENCEFLSTVIPSHLLGHLYNLKKLEVRSCSSVVAIFDVNDKVNVKSSNLKTMTLDQLPNVKHVWGKNPEGILSFEHLEEVEVTDCDCVQTLFPTASITESLRSLRIKNCGALEEIVEKVEAYEEGAVEELKLPCLYSLTLGVLPKLSSGSMKLRCPSLKILSVYHCGEFTKSQIFTSESQSCQGPDDKDQICTSNDSQSFFSVQQVGCLEEVSLTKEEATMLCNVKIRANVLSKLKGLLLHCFHNVTEANKLWFEILGKLTNVEILSVACSDMSEIFPQTLDPVLVKYLELTGLTLQFLPELNSIGIEHPSMNAIQQKLMDLHVERCPHLAKLVQSPVSFINLMTLYITKCHGLEYLFTTRTAKDLHNLWELTISDCKSIKEVVAQEEDGMDSDFNIIFESLSCMNLKSLPKLVCFYPGTSTLEFPDMGELKIAQCPKMNSFSQGCIAVPNILSWDIPCCVIGDDWQCYK